MMKYYYGFLFTFLYSYFLSISLFHGLTQVNSTGMDGARKRREREDPDETGDETDDAPVRTASRTRRIHAFSARAYTPHCSAYMFRIHAALRADSCGGLSAAS